MISDGAACKSVDQLPCSLCIDRRLYMIATAKVSMPTNAERHREAVIQDLLIGVGLPILQTFACECA